MRILAIDIGTSCGWAIGERPLIIASGVWKLQTATQRRFESVGMKWIRLRSYLKELHQAEGVQHIVVEEVRRHAGTDAAHAYGGALAVIQQWCEETGCTYEAIPVATIKRHATGKGNADKSAMIDAAMAKGWQVEDDNHADALWLLDLSMNLHS